MWLYRKILKKPELHPSSEAFDEFVYRRSISEEIASLYRMLISEDLPHLVRKTLTAFRRLPRDTRGSFLAQARHF